MKLGLSSVLLIGGAVSAFAAAPLPNASYLGISKNIQVTSYNGTGTAGGGGAFNGTVSGFATTFWCVDDQLYFSFNQSGLANVIGLNQIVANDTRVRYGNVHNGVGSPHWTNQTSPALPDSAQDRYRMAAYLIGQYDFATAGNPQSGLAGTAKNNSIQNTIWALTNNTSLTAQNLAAVTTPNAYWLAQAIANYQTIDLTKWAVVSWTVDSLGHLGTGAYNTANGARQTFLVQVVPEPRFYGIVLTLGLGLMVWVRRRRTESVAPSPLSD